ncbi:MAG TPA: hypothetical protein VL100_06430, partial [Croceibacterium sp.]|nr:hypothetical protein [Croceibacterium sp.]
MTVAGRVDCHAHCFDRAVQPIGGGSAFDLHPNELGSVEHFGAVLDSHGITHAVLVNPLGGYGTDNSYLLHVLRQQPDRFRGIALLAEDADDREVAELVGASVRG